MRQGSVPISPVSAMPPPTAQVHLERLRRSSLCSSRVLHIVTFLLLVVCVTMQITIDQHGVEQVMLQTPDVDQLRHWSQLYSAEAHLAGDLAHAERIRDLWRAYGISTELVQYDVLQNFPISTELRLLSADGSAAFEATLTEDELPEDPTSSPTRGLIAFHGFAANGDVQGQLVYANFASWEDFETLQRKGVSVEGKIVLCKYGKVFRGLKVRAAQEFGAVAVIIYNDPQEDGQYTAKNGYKHYPHGPARHPMSIQRGSVDAFSVAVGDPTTPGYPSIPNSNVERRDPTHAIPKIPSLPVSFAEAEPFLQALNGHGRKPHEMDNTDDWKGEIEGVEYSTGPSSVDVYLSSQGEFKYAPIYNVIGTIDGTTQECIVLGNHHDSWCCGAVDPVSGSAAMNEVARALGSLKSNGWQPYRKIILASWDNEEYGLVGSTEWGEDNAAMLSKNCVAYLNVDESTNGGQFLGAPGSPLLEDVIRTAALEVPSPINAGETVYSDWLRDQKRHHASLDKPSLTLMGTGSDYTVFFHHLGIASVDMIFNQQGQGVYPYHSNYDSFYWLDKFGDVGFKKHQAMARLWGLVAVKLAGVELIPFSTQSYAQAIRKHLDRTRQEYPSLAYSAVDASLQSLAAAATSFDANVKNVSRDGKSNAEDVAERINRSLIDLERLFLTKEDDGLVGRPWYRHQIFAPGLWLGYDGIVFPKVVEAAAAGDKDSANKGLTDVAGCIDAACALLRLR
ncbi:membrane transporter [Ilyonectria destructans]|nr:membrane transporter [Ilyonectria destructans]